MIVFVFFFKQKTAYEMRISDWSSDVCSSDLVVHRARRHGRGAAARPGREEALGAAAGCADHRRSRSGGHGDGFLVRPRSSGRHAAGGDRPALRSDEADAAARRTQAAPRAQRPRGYGLPLARAITPDPGRAEERRSGKKGVRTSKTRWAPYD